MKGRILDFNETDRCGVISGEDGNRYPLDIAEWKGSVLPRAGVNVDFSVTADRAMAVYPEVGTLNGASKKIAAALFAFFLGSFGAHKFYLGYTTQGIIMLLVFLFGFILLGIPSTIIGIIAFVECILYLIKTDAEFEQTYIINRRGWF